ncbi:hypothetical protein Ctob_011092, partial [Chrysochromulina tobinii]
MPHLSVKKILDSDPAVRDAMNRGNFLTFMQGVSQPKYIDMTFSDADLVLGDLLNNFYADHIVYNTFFAAQGATVAEVLKVSSTLPELAEKVHGLGVGIGLIQFHSVTAKELRCRLELDSKIENVLQPTWKALAPHSTLRVFLALETGACVHSNLDCGAILSHSENDACRTELTSDEIRERLHPWFGAARYVNHTTRDISLKAWPFYRQDRKTSEERSTRLQHHLSQFAHMRTCAQLIEESEVAQGRHYDMILKMRDNTIAVSPFALGARVPTWPQTKDCGKFNWRGYQDKVMLVPRRHTDAAMRAPAEEFFLHVGLGRTRGPWGAGIRNSEQLLKAVLDKRGVRVQQLDAQQMPLIDGRCSGRGGEASGQRRKSYCLVEENKDCRPATWTRDVKPCDCERNVTSEVKALHGARFRARKCKSPKGIWKLVCEQ